MLDIMTKQSAVFEEEPQCKKCVLTKYCTRKNIYHVDGYCRYDHMDEPERTRCIRNALYLVGDERWKEYDEALKEYE